MEFDVKSVGKRIYEARTAAGMSMAELARRIGVNQSSITRYEDGQFNRVGMDILIKIANALDVEVTYLIGFEPTAPTITKKDERDIAKDLDSIMEKLSNSDDGPLSYNGEVIPESTQQLLRDALDLGLRQLKIINKEKYGSKKGTKDK